MILGKQNDQNSASDAGHLLKKQFCTKQNLQNPASDAGFLHAESQSQHNFVTIKPLKSQIRTLALFM
jgi:hypothetical protein